MKFRCKDLIQLTAFSFMMLSATSSIHAENKVIYKNPSVVKVTAGDSVSSGLLVKQEKNNFFFVVSDHMFTGNTEDICVFFDQSQYGLNAMIHNRGRDAVDLALIRINTDLIELDEHSSLIQEASYEEGDQLYAIGYDLSGNLLIKKGKVIYVLNNALEGGYDVGVSADIEKGMSGGGIFDEKGRLIAITSVHADPLWETQLYYESGEAVGKKKSALISKYSMGISAKRLDQFLMKQEPIRQEFKSSQCSQR